MMAIIDIKIPDDNQEGTTMKVQNWLKSVGDVVVKDDPVLEVETDKVTMEVEAPQAGVITELLVDIGQDLQPGELIARLSTDVEPSEVQSDKPVFNITPEAIVSSHTVSAPNLENDNINNEIRLSPAVRKFVRENNLDVSTITGTGRGGRLTLNDVKTFDPNSVPIKTQTMAAPLTERSVPHSNMRRSIAEHMSRSVATAPHVTAVFEMNFTAIMAHRAKHKGSFAGQGVKLTYTAYFIQACVEAMKVVPQVNSRWHDDFLELFADVNVGVGASLGDKGLVVPVLQKAQTKNLLGIAGDLQDITGRARDNRLKPADMRGGTFTISNHGVSGSLVATPIIINQPQSAILGIGKLEKRVMVETIKGQDMMVIKPMAFVSLTIDHRVLDGSQTNAWLTHFVDVIENWPSD
ncbi:MAG: 2-oxo acid dehydrogenase subunit E2 [Litorimonas sp.]